jgi:N-acetylmuramoyl-L-alanine amidase
MKAKNIPAHETTFLQTGIDALGKQFKLKKKSVEVPGESKKLTIYQCLRDTNDESFFYKEETPKDKIVLHFTAGYLKGDIATLTTPGNHVSVSFVVGRSGNIFQLFDEKYWSYHLGPGATGGNTAMSKSAIGIEISNIGYLKKVGTNLMSSYGKTDVYCGAAESSYYKLLDTPFREQKHFATYTNEQYESVERLLKYLLHKHPSINRTLLDVNKRFQYLTDASQLKGIVSHINFRETGKWDIGPGFEWNRIEGVVQGPF